MDVSDFIELYNKTQEIEAEQKLWEHWLALRPIMTEDNFISFDEMLRNFRQFKSSPDTEYDEPAGGVYVDQCCI